MSNQILVCDCITLFRLTLIKNNLSVKTYKYEYEPKLHTARRYISVIQMSKQLKLFYSLNTGIQIVEDETLLAISQF